MKVGQPTSMEERLASVGRHIDQLMRKTLEVDGLGSAAQEELEVWKRWRDELTLQAHLGVMEARDAVGPTLEKLEDAMASLVSGMDDVTNAVDAEELGERIKQELSGLRRELESAGADFRIA